jgi:hypothetical protein
MALRTLYDLRGKISKPNNHCKKHMPSHSGSGVLKKGLRFLKVN